MLLATIVAVALSSAPRIIEDDFPKALATAKRQGKLLFVDAWAPWCHTCIFMREHVLNRPEMGAFEKDIVFAAVDTEKSANTKFLEAFPIESYPTLLIIDPSTQKPLVRWLGTIDAPQLEALLSAARASRDGADALLGEGKASLAATKYLAASDLDTRSSLSAITALAVSNRNAECVEKAADTQAKLGRPQDRLVAVGFGLGCATELPIEQRVGPAYQALVDAASVLTTEPLRSTLFADDVSSLYDATLDLTQGDEAKKEVARTWLGYLDEQAAKAATPAARAVFDPHRTSAAIATGVPSVMIGPLMQSEKDFPADYNPPARLALVLREMGKYPEALAAINRGLAKCKEGPRKLRLYDTKWSIQDRSGDRGAALQTLGEAVKYAKALPSSLPVRARALTEFQKRYDSALQARN